MYLDRGSFLSFFFSLKSEFRCGSCDMSAAKTDNFFKYILFFSFLTLSGEWSEFLELDGAVKRNPAAASNSNGGGSSPAAARGWHGSPGGAGRPATGLIQLGEFCDASHGFCSSFALLRSLEATSQSHLHTAPKGQPSQLRNGGVMLTATVLQICVC